MTISGERTEQLDIFCHVAGFTSDFLSFIDVELIRFFHGGLQLFIFANNLVQNCRRESRHKSKYRLFSCRNIFRYDYCCTTDSFSQRWIEIKGQRGWVVMKCNLGLHILLNLNVN